MRIDISMEQFLQICQSIEEKTEEIMTELHKSAGVNNFAIAAKVGHINGYVEFLRNSQKNEKGL